MTTQTGRMTLTGTYLLTPTPPNSSSTSQGDTSSSAAGAEPQQTSALGGAFFPLGALIPIASHLTGSCTLPESGQVSEDGFMRCDGAEIPAGHLLSGRVPDLTDGRFLRGAQTAGQAGGRENFILMEDNLPVHAHSINHEHDGVIDNAGSHNHGMGVAGNHFHHLGTSYDHGAPRPNDYFTVIRRSGDTSNAAQTQHAGNHTHSLHPAGDHTHGLTIEAHAGQSGEVGGSNPLVHIPQYFDVVYLIRVH